MSTVLHRLVAFVSCICIVVFLVDVACATPALVMHFDEGSGLPLDSSSFNNVAYSFSGVWVKPGKFGNAAVDLTNGNVNMGSPSSLAALSGNTSWTVSAWIKYTGNGGTDYSRPTFFMESQPSTAPKAFGLVRTGNGVGMFCTLPGVGSGDFLTNAIPALLDHDWHYVCYRLDASNANLTMSVDGTVIRSVTNISPINLANFGSDWYIGNNGQAAAYGNINFIGMMDNFSVTIQGLSDPKAGQSSRNQLFNGGFEHGADGWYPKYYPVINGNVTPNGTASATQSINFTNPHSGINSIALQFPIWRYQNLQSMYFKLPWNGQYTLSFWARASQNATLTANIIGASCSPKTDFSIGTSWQRYTLTSDIIPEDRNLVQIAFSGEMSTSCTVWIDDVMFYNGDEGGLTAYATKDPVELGLDFQGNNMSVIQHAFLDNESVSLVVTAYSMISGTGTVYIEAIDFYGKVIPIAQTTMPLAANGITSVQIPITLSMLGRGLFMVHATVKIGGQLSGENFTNMALFDSIAGGLGLSGNYSAGGNEFWPTDQNIAFNRKLGVNFMKLMDCGTGYDRWQFLQPDVNGQFYFNTINNQDPATINEIGAGVDYLERIQYLRNHGIALQGVLAYAPRWAVTSPPPDGTFLDFMRPPMTSGDLALYKTYVETTINRLGGYIDRWEIWNEPGWWGGITTNANAQTYAAIVNTAGESIRRLKPDAKIIVYQYEGTNPGDNFASFLSQVNPAYVDIISIHDLHEDGASVTSYINNLSQQYLGAVKPIWNTETYSIGCRSVWWDDAFGLTTAERATTQDQLIQAADLIRMHADQIGCGIKKIMMYWGSQGISYPSIRNNVSGILPSSAGYGYPSVFGAALATVTSLLYDASASSGGNLTSLSGLQYYLLQRANGSAVAFFWAKLQGSYFNITAPYQAGLYSVDLMNNRTAVTAGGGGMIHINNIGYMPTIITFPTLAMGQSFIQQAGAIICPNPFDKVLLLMPFIEGCGVPADTSGCNNTVKAFTAAWITPGKIGNWAVDLTNGYVNVGNQTDTLGMLKGSASWTVSAWIKYTGNGGTDYSRPTFFMESQPSTAPKAFGLVRTGNGVGMFCTLPGVGSGDFLTNAIPALLDHDWHYVCYRLDASNANLTMSVDGTVIRSVTNISPINLANFGSDWYIGNNGQTAAYGNINFTGMVNNFTITATSNGLLWEPFDGTIGQPLTSLTGWTGANVAISDQEIDTGNSAVFQANGTGAAYADKILAAVRTLAPGEKAVLSWVAKTGSAGTIEKSIRVILLNQAGTQRARIDLLKAANGLVHIAPLMLSSSWYCGQQIAVGADTVKMKIEMDTSSTKFYYYNNGWQLIYSLNIPMDSLYSLEIWGNYDGWIDSMKLEVW